MNRASGSPTLPIPPPPLPPPPPPAPPRALLFPPSSAITAPSMINPGAAGVIYSMSQYINPFLQVNLGSALSSARPFTAWMTAFSPFKRHERLNKLSVHCRFVACHNLHVACHPFTSVEGRCMGFYSGFVCLFCCSSRHRGKAALSMLSKNFFTIGNCDSCVVRE